jgi:hypothetical protein
MRSCSLASLIESAAQVYPLDSLAAPDGIPTSGSGQTCIMDRPHSAPRAHANRPHLPRNAGTSVGEERKPDASPRRRSNCGPAPDGPRRLLHSGKVNMCHCKRQATW